MGPGLNNKQKRSKCWEDQPNLTYLNKEKANKQHNFYLTPKTGENTITERKCHPPLYGFQN